MRELKMKPGEQVLLGEFQVCHRGSNGEMGYPFHFGITSVLVIGPNFANVRLKALGYIVTICYYYLRGLKNQGRLVYPGPVETLSKAWSHLVEDMFYVDLTTVPDAEYYTCCGYLALVKHMRDTKTNAVGAVLASSRSHAHVRTPCYDGVDSGVIALATARYIVVDTAKRAKSLIEAWHCSVYTYGSHAPHMRNLLKNVSVFNVSESSSRTDLWLKHHDDTRTRESHYYDAPLEPAVKHRSAQGHEYYLVGDLTNETKFATLLSSTPLERFENDKLWIADAKACLRLRVMLHQYRIAKG